MAAEAAAAGKEKMRTLVSSDFKKFDVEESVARESLIILNLMADCDDSDIPVFNVNAKILDKVIAYCRKHASAPRADGGDAEPSAASNKASADDLKSFDAEFVDVDLVTLLELIKAADYLEINGLLDLTCHAVADMIKGKTPEEIRETFDIENDFTPEEEAKVRRENQWAFE